MKSTYYVVLHTNEKCSADEYAAAAERAAGVMEKVFGDASSISAFTRAAALTECHSEMEISHSENGIVGKCVMEMEAPSKVVLDKAKLTATVKGLAAWPDLKVEKRSVQTEGV